MAGLCRDILIVIMKNQIIRIRRPLSGVAAILPALLLALTFAHSATAASATWLPTPFNNNWLAAATTNNWSTGAGTFPGSQSGTSSADIATFNTNSTVTTINCASAFVIGGITFDTANASAYTINTSGGTWRVSLNGNANGAVIKTTSTVVNRQTVTGTLRLATSGTLTLTSDSATPSATLNITSGASVNNSGSSGTLVLNGANTGNNIFGAFTEQTPATIWGSLIKSGTGTWLLTGNSTYHSNTFVLGGTLGLIGSANLPNSTVIVVSNATLSVSNSLTSTNLLVTNAATVLLTNTFFRSPIAISTLSTSNSTFRLGVNGSTPFTNIVVTSALNAGPGTALAIDQVVNVVVATTFSLISYAGADPDPGSFIVTVPSGYTAGPVTVDTGNKLVTVTITPPASASSLVWVGATNSVPVSNWDTTTKDWVDAATLNFAQAYANPDSVSFDDTAHSSTVTLLTTVTPFGVTINNSTLNYLFNGSGKISGVFGLIKQGGANLTLAESGGDDFTGGLTVGAGTLILDDTNCAISGGVTISGGAVLQIGQNDANGALPSGSLTDDGTLIFSRSNNVTLSTSISGNGGLTQNGNSTLTLNNTNGYFGNTFIAKGKLALTGAGSISNSSSLIISNAAFDVSSLPTTTVLNDLNIANATINVGPTNALPSLKTTSFEVDGVIGTSNIINVLALPVIASYPATIPIIKSSGINLSGGNFNFALGSLPAASPAYAGSLSESADNTSVLLTLTNGPVGIRPSVTWAGVINVSTNTNWSARVNWQLPGAPTAIDSVFFDGTTTVADNLTINNVVDTTTTVSNLTYNQTANNQWHNTFIPTGNVLAVTGTTGIGAAPGSTTLVTISGPGELDANGPFSLNGPGGTSDSHITLDMSGLGTFKNIAPTATMALGTAQQNFVTLSLASTNFINVATLNLEATGGANGRTGTLNLGAGTNTIYAGNINISTGKGATTKIQFGTNAPAGTVTIGGTGGGSARAAMLLGNATSGSAVCNGQLLLAGHLANVLAGTVTLGGVGGSTNSGSIGMITLDNGTFDATSILMGSSTSAHGSSGTFALGGDPGHTAILNVSSAGGGSLVLGNASITNGTAAGTLTILSNGIANINCSITKNGTLGANNTATISITDGTLNQMSGTIGTPALPIDALNLSDNGSMDTVLELNVTVGVTNIVATAVNATGTNTLKINSLAGLTGTTQIPLISYTGADPFVNFALGSVPAGYTGAMLMDNTAAQTIDLQITPPTPLVWRGAVGSSLNSTWDTNTHNWFSASAYADPDFVQFDDTASNNVVTLAATVAPGGIVVNDSALNYTFNGPGKISGTTALLKQGAGILTLDNSGSNDFTGGVNIAGGALQIGNNDTGGVLPAGNIVADGTLAFSRADNLTVPNLISGAGGVSQINTNVVTLSGTNSYSGATFISSGTLKINNTNALGSWSGAAVTITNGGTLDIGGFSAAFAQANADFGAKQFKIAGAGVGGNGAIINSGTNQQLGAFQTITLTDNAAVGGRTRWDMRNGTPALDLQGFKLTKTGSNQISMVAVSVTSGDIDINQGTLSFEANSTVNGTGTLTVNNGGSLGHFRLAGGALTLPLVLNGGAITNLATTGAGSINDAPITLKANSVLGGSTSATNAITLNGVIGQTGGSFGLTKVGAGGFILTSANTYSGATLVNAGTLTLTGNGSIGNSGTISLNSGASLDVSGRSDGTLTLNANQTLSGSGTVTGVVTTVAGATVAPGSSATTGALTATGNITLGGTNIMKLNATAATNDVLATGGILTYGGTLYLTNLSGTLTSNSTFKLFSASPGNYSGAFSAIVPASPGGGVGWNTNTLATDGVLRFIATVNTNPTNITVAASGNSLTLSWPADHTGWRLQAKTNSLAGGVWSDVPGSTSVNSITVPIAPGNVSIFYRMVYP